ncbi:MAG: hypothetical protein KC492_37045, partial [Myxococcales bacterium]|nr:hypothetical protein [Myxococcales bacterium]
DDHVSTHGMHLGLFASAGFALLSFRVVPPLSTLEPNHGTEVSLTLGLKFFFALHGRMLETFTTPHGRPLRVAGAPRSLRNPLVTDWSDAALAEHESVASFAALALDLLNLGAPRALVRACHEAAREELAHVEFCEAQSAAASVSTDRPSLAPLLDEYCASSLEELVVSCFLDGCLGEGFAALEAELTAQHAQAADTRRGLRELAAEEARHAELAWRVLDWAQRTSPQTHAEALGTALTRAARHDAPLTNAYGALPEALGALAFETTRLAASTRALASLRQNDSGIHPALSA